jgi:hypothetical protein
MSRRPDGKRGRRKPDPAEETASWLLEVEQAGQAAPDEEDDWAGTLRATRREATGQFPGVPRGEPREAPPPREPPSAREAPRRYDPPQQHVGSDTGGSDANTGGWGTNTGGWETNTGGWGGAPAPREPEPWDTHAGSESWNGGWPFEETGQSWEPDDRSYTWPVQELPSNTGSWDNAERQDPWGGGQTGQGSYEPGQQTGGYPSPSPYESSRGYGSPPEYGPTGYEQAHGGHPAGSPPAEGDYEPASYGTGEQPLARPYLDQGVYRPQDAYPASNGYGPPAQEGYDQVHNPLPEQGYGPGAGYDLGYDQGYDQGYGAQDAGYGQADSSYPSDPGLAVGNGYPMGPSDDATGELGTGEYGPGGGDAPDSGYPSSGTYPPSSGRFGPESGYRADAGYPPPAAYEPPAGTYPGARGYDNGFGGDRSGDPYATAESFATGPGAPAGPAIGGTGAGAPGIAGQPPRPDIWPAQTGSWEVDEPVRPRGGGASGEFSMLREGDEQVVRLGAVGDAGARGARPEWGSRPRGTRNNEARPVDADGEHISARARWPKVVALISWIILLMVLCWFYVFPFLERILPENF